MTLVNIKVPIEIKEQLEQMKVHERQATHEIIHELLEKAALYDKYCLMMGNDCMIDDGK